jgi:hypothetical protein
MHLQEIYNEYHTQNTDSLLKKVIKDPRWFLSRGKNVRILLHSRQNDTLKGTIQGVFKILFRQYLRTAIPHLHLKRRVKGQKSLFW